MVGNIKMNDGPSRTPSLAGEIRQEAELQKVECMGSQNGRTCHGISDKGSIWELRIKKTSWGRNYLNWTLARIQKDAGGVCWPPRGVAEEGR